MWGGPSAEANVFASRATYGTLATASTRDDLLNSRLIILWGCNPASNIFSTNTSYYLIQAKEKGAEVVGVDPILTNTVATFADQWIPIRPATDAAMLIGMAHVMIEEGLQDQNFLDTHTTGFDKFEDYVTGKEDGIAKTPEWAEAITGVPAATIRDVARRYATTKPAYLFPGFGPGRTAYGEQFHRAMATLACMTGNVGIPGSNAAGFGRGPVGGMIGPVRANDKGSLDTARRNTTRVHYAKAFDAILRGRDGGYPTDAKLLYVMASDPVTQFLNTRKGEEALQNPEFIVVQDIFMTATARFADIVLPAASPWESESGILRPWYFGPYYLYMKKVIEPLYECKSDYDIAAELAARLGVTEFTYRTEDERTGQLFRMSSDLIDDIPDYEAFRRDGFYKMPLTAPIVAFAKEISDPEQNPFPTPSGKIEIYSERLAAFNNSQLPPIPKYVAPWEGPEDPLVQKYPLQLINPAAKNRAHSNFDNVPLLREIEPQTIWISSADARVRGIQAGDMVEVFNNRGTVLIQATVTERIMPGVVALPAGAWYAPDDRGRDLGGCANVLTMDEFSPGGAFCSNSCLVEVEKV
jgi:anaerobic dimethyl sulfoxide reductase subunit A